MVQKGDHRADQVDRCFVEPAVERDGPVPIDSPLHPVSEVIIQVLGSLPEQVGMFTVPVQRALPGTGMDVLVVLGIEPFPESFVQLLKAHPVGTAAQELLPYRPEEPLDFPPALRLVRFGVDEGDAQGGCGMPELMGEEGGAIIHIELSGQPTPLEGFP